MAFLKLVIVFLLIGFLQLNSSLVIKPPPDVQVLNENFLEAVTQVYEPLSEDTNVDAQTEAINASTVPGNDFFLGKCEKDDVLLYFDDTMIDNSGPSTLNGTMEIYIDAPVRIHCVEVYDQRTDGSGAIPSFHSGGVGHDFVKITVNGKYGKGFHFKIYVRGVFDQTKKMPLTQITNNQI